SASGSPRSRCPRSTPTSRASSDWCATSRPSSARCCASPPRASCRRPPCAPPGAWRGLETGDRPVNILVTNDDGILAPALRALRTELASLGRVVIVAPDRDQSATSHSLTLHRPFRIHRHDVDIYSVDGTPTDCVVCAWYGLLDVRPDLVISGINHGPNMGEDVFYSGTVAAAIEGAMQGATALSVSLATRELTDFLEPAAFVGRLARTVTERGLPRRRLLNV